MRRWAHVGAAFAAGLSLAAGSSARADTLDHIATFEWPTDIIVGLSGLEVSPNGQKFDVVGDQGWWLSGTFVRADGPDAPITALEINELRAILGNDGRPVAARRTNDWADSEGLAIAPDGTRWVSFERWAHVSRYDGTDQWGQWIKDHPSFAEHRQNRQLEALALHPDGSLYTFPERPLRAGFPMYRLDDAGWAITGHIAPRNRFAIVGADFDDNGDLYLLERRLVLGWWWRSRIRRLQVDDPDGIETLWTSGLGEYYNLEGIAVWRDAAGLRLTIVSDNNADPDEPTQFVEFRLLAD